MDVDDVACHLYGLPLGEFVAARDAMAKQAKNDGAADAAARIKALRKPTQAAWLANQLVREYREDVDDLITVGEEMRAATISGDGAALREAAARRKKLADTLLAHAAKLGGGKQRLSNDLVEALNETLLAATADPGVAEQLREGRLTHPLQHVGFGQAGGGAAQVISLSQARAARAQRGERGVASTTTRARTHTATVDDYSKIGGALPTGAEADREQRRRRQRAEAERDFEVADHAVIDAENRVTNLELRLDENRGVLEGAESTVERLIAEVEAARAELERARTGVEDAEEELDQAREELDEARKRRREAKRQLL